MGSKVDVPATTDPTAGDWQNFIAWVEKAQTGKINITFSNMDNTLEPQIQAGSIVEIAGSLYSFSAEEAATGWTGIANSTQAYMRLAASGDTVSAEWTTTAPVYRDDLQGWYESGTNKRYVLASYKDGAGDYTVKVKVTNVYYGDNTFSGDIFATGLSPFSRIESLTTTGAETWTVPANVYKIKVTIIGAGGGGGAEGSGTGSDGGATTFNSVSASGGLGGIGGNNNLDGYNSYNGLVSGNGGMGGTDNNSYSGRNGAGGEIKKEVFNVTPGDTISYSVGTGGAGGTALRDGGDGGDGQIIIEY